MRKSAVWLLFLLLAFAAPLPAVPKKTHKLLDLADTVDNNVILSKFAKLVEASDLGTFLSSRGPFTLFAPTNSAFSKLPPGMFEDLLRPENKEQLQRIVLFHVVNGAGMDVKDLAKAKSLVSCEGNPIPLRTTKAGTVFINKARLLHGDQKCANGVLDEIDTLLLPPKLGVLVSAPMAPPSTDTNAAPDMTSPAGSADSSANVPTGTSEPDTNVPPVPPVQ